MWGDGNILLGGGGSDTIEGRGADDIIDGDKYLNVRLTVRTDVNDPATQIEHDRPERSRPAATSAPGTAGMTLQQAVFAGLVDPGNIAIVREVILPAAGLLTGTIDTALFSAPLVDPATLVDNYTIVTNPDGSVTISDAAGASCRWHRHAVEHGASRLLHHDDPNTGCARPTSTSPSAAYHLWLLSRLPR